MLSELGASQISGGPWPPGPLRAATDQLYKLPLKVMMNYEPRESLCSPACALGVQLKVPVYKFLKESITRKYGRDFYTALEKIASESEYFNEKE